MNTTIARRVFLTLPIAATLPGRARAAMLSITDALGRTVVLKVPAERIVVGVNFEEFTAVSGPAGWDPVVGFDRRQWENSRASWTRYQAVASGHIPTGWAPMSAEYVLAAAPEHIFMTASSWTNAPNAARTGYDYDIETTRRTLAPYVNRPCWNALPSIRDNELHAIETGLARSLWDWTGTRYIAKQLHLNEFSDVDLVQSLRHYHEQFLPVTFEGCWMARVTPARA